MLFGYGTQNDAERTRRATLLPNDLALILRTCDHAENDIPGEPGAAVALTASLSATMALTNMVKKAFVSATMSMMSGLADLAPLLRLKRIRTILTEP